jgi:hypothetical protein
VIGVERAAYASIPLLIRYGLQTRAPSSSTNVMLERDHKYFSD